MSAVWKIITACISVSETIREAASYCQQMLCRDWRKKKKTFLQVLGFHIASHIWRYWPKAVLQNEKGSPWWKVKHECQCWVFAATTHPSWIYLELFTFVLKQVSLWAQSFQFCSYVGCFFFFCSALHTPKKHLFSFLFLYLFKGHKHLLLCHIHLCCYCSSDHCCFLCCTQSSPLRCALKVDCKSSLVLMREDS